MRLLVLLYVGVYVFLLFALGISLLIAGIMGLGIVLTLWGIIRLVQGDICAGSAWLCIGLAILGGVGQLVGKKPRR